MTPEDFNYFQSRVTRFISGSSSGIKFGSSVAPKYTRLSSIIPKRALPQQVLETIQRKTTSDSDEGIEASPRGISALGKVTLNLEQTKNNLEKILEIIAEDYKTTRETNRKESDELRKRIANRGRIFGKKELGDKKSDVLGIVKKYVGSFFSGAGGAIRGLAMFNLLQGLLSGDPSKIIGPLLGIGLTYVPSIIGSVIGGVVGSIGTGLVGRMFGGGARAAAPAAPAAGTAAGASRLGGLGRLGGRAALVGGSLALASSLFNRPQEDTQQQRLEQLTEQQKGLVAPSAIGPLPENELQRFDRLNKKFEEALDFLMGKRGGQQQQQTSGGGGGGGGSPTPPGQPISGPAPAEINALMSAISAGEGGLESVNKIGALPGLSQMTIDQAIAKVEGLKAQGKTSGAMGNMQQKSQFLRERAIAAGLDPSTALFNEENQYKINRAYLASLFSGGEQQIVDLIRSGKINDVVNKLKGVWPSLPGGSQQNVHTSSFYQKFDSYLKQLGVGSISSPTPIPPSPRNIPSPQSQTPNITLVPVTSGQQSPSSDAAIGNDVVPAIDTTYPENFLALYSKLIYQIV
jgi:hypothetical protein